VCTGRRTAISPVTAACCEAGDCADGVPPTCSEECAGVFIPFMDDYNHGACMPLMQTVGATLHLGDLEARCRESLGTDGGADASRTDCSTAAAMPIVLACSRETTADAYFCESPCYAVLAPYVEECSAEIPSYIEEMLAPVLSMVEPCAAEQPAEPECDMMTTMTACTNDPPGARLDCENTCLQNLFICQDDPMLPAVFGPRMVAQLPALQSMCVVPEGATAGGDGICDMVSLQRCAAGGRELDAECGPGPRDPRCTCASDCVQEYIDCVDSPVMARSRADIVLTQQMCASDGLDRPGGAKYAGDGACDLFS
jgi:hypothetical protein